MFGFTFKYRGSTYSNNALVFYKSHSSPTSSTGTVRNHRAIARRT